MKNLFTAFLLLMLFSSITIIQAQTPITPVDLATVIDADLTVTWTAFGTGNYDYEVVIGGALTGTPTVSNTASTSFPILEAAISNGQTVNWQVRDYNGGAPLGWNVYSFTVNNPTPTPADGAIAVSQATASVSWTDFDEGGFGNGTYDVEFDDDIAFGSTNASALATASTSLALPALAYNTTYYWRVRDTDTDGVGTDGAWQTYSFTTEIATPVITAPTAAQVGVSVTPTITWTFAGGTGGVTFKIRTATDAGITTNVVTHTSTTTGTSFTITSALNYNTSYWVEVTAQKALEADKVVVIGGSFKTAYATPTQVSPVDAAKDVNKNYKVDFTYTAVEPAYEIEISNNSAFTAATSYDAGNTGTVSLDLSALSYYTTYYWRIRALDSYPIGVGVNYSAWSTTRSFKTIDNYTASTPFPTDGSTDIVNSSIQFIWQLLGRNDYSTFQSPSFKLVYDTDVNFTTAPVVLTSGFIATVSTGMRFLGLDPGITYYWKIITVKPSNEGENYQTPITADPLVIGQSYEVQLTGGGADFSAVGGPAAPTAGDIFIATATTGAIFGTNSLIVSGDVATSATWSFTTSGAVVKPIIAYPKDETTVYSPVPIFYWYTMGFNTAHEYEIEWSTNAGDLSNNTVDVGASAIVASSTKGFKNGLEGLFGYPTPALEGGQHFYWHVRSYIPGDPTNHSDWSDIEDFYTFDAVDAAIPVPAYPTGGVEVYSKFPVMYWTLSGPSQGLTFNIRYGTGLTGSNVNVGSPGVTSWTINDIAQLYATLYQGIVGGTTYYWQVQSDNGTTTSAWSDYAEFSIYDFTADLKPILSWPIGGNLVYSTDVNFAWHVEGPSLGLSYVLEYDSTGLFTGDETTISGIPTNLKTVSLTAGITYYWRVRVDNAENSTNWSDVESFEVISGNGANVPILNWPVGGATVWSTSQDLSWTLVNGGSPTFEVQVFTNAGLSVHFGGSPYTAVASSPLNITGLTAGATYYWRVRVEGDPDGAGPLTNYPWSNVEVFIVFAGLSPEAPPTLAAVPRLGSPIGGVEVSSTTPTLSFFSPTYSEGNISYDLEYSKNSDFSNSVVKTDLATPHYTTDGLSAGTYYWRVRGKDAEGTYSGYSDQGTFKVTGVTAVENEEGVPQSYELSQNYPNPFNPSTLIKFSMPEAGYVTLKIYNMLGQEIKTLVNEQINAGVNTVTWNGQDNFGHKVSSGAYIYQIVSGNFVQTRKMILLK